MELIISINLLYLNMLKSFSKKKSCASDLSSKLKSLDIYGEQIKLTFKGDDTFKTSIGAVISAIVLFMLGAWALFLIIILLTRNGSNFNSFDYIQDLNSAGSFEP
jgi:large-conductance mechanosensitive channel